MDNEKLLCKISTIQRGLGIIEGVTSCLDKKYSDPIFDALLMIDEAVKEIQDG